MVEIEAIFFDVDGTLVDSSEDIVRAMNYTMTRLGLPERPKGEIVSYIGTGVRDLVRKCLGRGNADFADKAVRIFSNYYMRHSADHSKLYPHVKETLGYFKVKRKFILTNRFKRFADATLREFGIRKYFEDIVGGDDENCMKPSACVLDKAVARLGIDAMRALVVGDMAIDIKTGKNSGISTCWVTYGLGKRGDFRNLKPDYIIDDILELKDIIR